MGILFKVCMYAAILVIGIGLFCAWRFRKMGEGEYLPDWWEPPET